MSPSTVFARPVWDRNDISASWLDHVSPQLNIAGREQGRPAWVDPQRVIYDHEIMMMGEGGHFAYDLVDSSGTTRTIECRGASYIIIPPGVWHTCRGIHCEGVTRAWLHFDWVAVPRPAETPILTYWPASPLSHLFRHAPEFVPKGILTGPISNPVLALDIQERVTERLNHGTARMRATSRALLLELLLYLLATESSSPARASATVDLALHIRGALDALAQKPFADADKMKPYLAGLGHCYDHLARVFRATYGVTPLQYLNTQRLERAKDLLRDSNAPVAHIARKLGYRDVIYFNRLFRKFVGITPGTFRKTQ